MLLQITKIKVNSAIPFKGNKCILDNHALLFKALAEESKLIQTKKTRESVRKNKE